ncbi:MAG: WbqC family protein [Bacteroidaceae bacterium]|nr:WbqC family protein [Bacteroidaceae bacterium]
MKQEKIGIMQPYFFPYIGYWQLIHAVDVFVVYDDGKMITNGWIHRNRILDFDGQTPRTIGVPLKKKSVSHTIGEMERAEDNRQMKQMVEMIKMRYRRAPHYQEVMPMLEELILNDETNMVKYLTHSLRTVCDFLGIKTRFEMSSTIDKTGCEGVEDKAERICKTIGITNYINPIGGTEFYDKDEWAKRGLTLNFLRRRETISYPQFGGVFVPDLSIIDMLMFCSKEEIQNILNEYEIL